MNCLCGIYVDYHYQCLIIDNQELDSENMFVESLGGEKEGFEAESEKCYH